MKLVASQDLTRMGFLSDVSDDANNIEEDKEDEVELNKAIIYVSEDAQDDAGKTDQQDNAGKLITQYYTILYFV